MQFYLISNIILPDWKNNYKHFLKISLLNILKNNVLLLPTALKLIKYLLLMLNGVFFYKIQLAIDAKCI